MVKLRDAQSIAENMLTQLDLQKGQKWIYDPHQVISKKRQESKASAYNHEPNEYLQRAANLETWEQVKEVLHEGDQQQERSQQSIQHTSMQGIEQSAKSTGPDIIDLDKLEQILSQSSILQTPVQEEKG